ncbi:TonB-dependent siderophore receptor [Brenneria tiliae]|uniref:TonB-dependent receptor n=1 Tax=Brenneria tiliae TaxID=2914984 RepID=A0ABT0MTV7_9GAMM|nr:TonB-dependent receptor [Brenneria tiliae]MCL2893255.1 TonB-dependent receptor [Brenneria tiliae]
MKKQTRDQMARWRERRGASVFYRIFFTGALMFKTGALLGVAVPLAANAATAQEQVAFSIPTGDLQQGLLAVARQSGQTISFTPALVDNYRHAALNGRYSTREAILFLLRGTPLLLTATDNGTLTISSSRQDGVEQALDGQQALPAITVSASADEGFLTDTTQTTRSGAPLHLTPQSITAVNSEVMRQQGAQNVADALRNVSGVTVQPGSMGASSVNIRGYQSSVLVDGFNASSLSTPLDFPAIALESVEVLKGPGALLVGSSSQGGVVNITRKRPQAEDQHEIRLGYGSYNERQLALDTTGGLTDDGRLSYRLIISGVKSDRNSAHYDGKKDFYFAPSLRWQDDTTDFQLSFSRNVKNTPYNPYTVMYRGKPWTGDLPQPLGRKDDKLTLRQNIFSYSLEQKLSANWEFISKASYDDSQMFQYGYYNGLELADDMTVWLNTYAQGGHGRSLDTENYLRAKYDWGELSSTSVIGVSASRTNTENYSVPFSYNWYQVSINEPLPELPPSNRNSTSNYTESRPLGVFAQQNLDYGDWHLSSGLRYSTSWHGAFNHSEASVRERREVWSPSVGLLYEITPWVAIYGNYLEGYQPPAGVDSSGKLLPAQTSRQREAGLKFDLFDSRLSVTTAVYSISYDNYRYQNPVTRGYEVTSGYASRGFEVDFQGNVLPGLDIIGHYNYGKAELNIDEDYREALPRHHASLWANYQFQSPQLSGFSAGVGLTYSSAAYTSLQKTYTIPAQLQTDVSLGYRVGNYSLDLTVKNVFDEDLYVSPLGGDPNFVPLQQPRWLLLTASYQF